ncbi:MAG TPA: hypothetical protein VH092_37855, partial [Urbifossiella sp.]|nr:hypothetical protein [Urbifossiella sp.]
MGTPPGGGRVCRWFAAGRPAFESLTGGREFRVQSGGGCGGIGVRFPLTEAPMVRRACQFALPVLVVGLALSAARGQ